MCIKSSCYYSVNKWNISLTDIFSFQSECWFKETASWTPSQNHSFEWETGRGKGGGAYF